MGIQGEIQDVELCVLYYPLLLLFRLLGAQYPTIGGLRGGLVRDYPLSRINQLLS